MFRIIEGDCIEAMAAMEPDSVDAIVTDPPYGLEFMGKEWDRLWAEPDASFTERPKGGTGPFDRKRASYGSDTKAMQEWHHAWATEALRVLRPGGHLLAFGGTRTYHRLTCAIEDAGFEIRDCLAWLYGSGFPKSLDVSKAIDKAAGAEREVVANPLSKPTPRSDKIGQATHSTHVLGEPKTFSKPLTPDAQHWNGWGTALKPAFEPIVLARKPLSERNVAANVLRWGVGALNVDGCRIEGRERTEYGLGASTRSKGSTYGEPSTSADFDASQGRWPANVTLDETAAAMLDEQSGERTPSFRAGNRRAHKPGPYTIAADYDREGVGYGDTGGASRFFKVVEPDEFERCPTCRTRFRDRPLAGCTDEWHTTHATRFRYVPKADRAERNNGLGHMEEQDGGAYANGAGMPGRTQTADGTWVQTDLAQRKARANTHPTVKPIALMAWLCRMVTPKGGTVLDPFTGSGSTGIAALREGFEFIGLEREPEYVEIARARILGDAPLFNVEDTDAQPA